MFQALILIHFFLSMLLLSYPPLCLGDSDIERNMQYSEEILRYLVVRKDGE